MATNRNEWVTISRDFTEEAKQNAWCQEIGGVPVSYDLKQAWSRGTCPWEGTAMQWLSIQATRQKRLPLSRSMPGLPAGSPKSFIGKRIDRCVLKFAVHAIPLVN